MKIFGSGARFLTAPALAATLLASGCGLGVDDGGGNLPGGISSHLEAVRRLEPDVTPADLPAGFSVVSAEWIWTDPGLSEAFGRAIGSLPSDVVATHPAV